MNQLLIMSSLSFYKPVVIVVCFCIASCSKTSPVVTPVSPVTTTTPVSTTPTDTAVNLSAYTLAWSDEFSGTSVDTTKWTFETGNLGVNNEREYYQASNATVANGTLMITAKKETVGNFLYTSARMNTLNKFSAQYGRIEARIKLPLAAGLWPAFWSMGANIQSVNWPQCGEMDIMEHVNADNIIYGTMHWNVGGHVYYGLNTTTTAGDYHIYAIEWDASSIRWYVDNTLYCTGNIANNINTTGAFHLPFFLLLNMAVGGDFPGQTIDLTKLPATMYVDYVRVYKAK